jgi:hypothetical protein
MKLLQHLFILYSNIALLAKLTRLDLLKTSLISLRHFNTPIASGRIQTLNLNILNRVFDHCAISLSLLVLFPILSKMSEFSLLNRPISARIVLTNFVTLITRM